VFFAFSSIATAEQYFPGPDWKEQPDPIASPDAEPGGKFSLYVAQWPKSFNYYLENSAFNSDLFGYLYEVLLSSDSITRDPTPGLANRWSISDDMLTFTFHIDPKAKWSDGKPITAHDVKWTFEAILDPKNLTGVHKIGLEQFESSTLIDDRTIRFKAKRVHWKNLLSLQGFAIFPKHVFDGQDFNKINFEFPVVSGPYQISEVQDGTFVRLKKRQDWWAIGAKQNQNIFNFDILEFRFYTERETAFEAFKKGQIDVFSIYTSHRWVRETQGDKFDRNLIIKQQIYNYKPASFQGYAINMRIEPYSDIRVRKALAHLYDRPKMNEQLMYNQYELLRSYYPDLYGKDHPNRHALYEFDKDKARALLKEAGWKANAKTGNLEKDGKPLIVNLLTRDSTSEKFLAIYREDLKDVGIQLNNVQKDWAAWSKDMDEFNFELTIAAWAGGSFKDAEGMWHSKEADRIQGNNITGFKNPRVDELSEKMATIFDVNERDEIMREIDTLIYNDAPYVLQWGNRYVRLLRWNKFGTPDTVLSKFGRAEVAAAYWWIDPDSEADLEAALDSGDKLPSQPFKVFFDETFQPRQ
jgi:microcin C transport system substrate-binding protein